MLVSRKKRILEDIRGYFVNDVNFQNKVIKKSKQLIETLTNPKNKELIDNYQKNVNIINKRKSLIDDLLKIIISIDDNVGKINNMIKNIKLSYSLFKTIPLLSDDNAKISLNANIDKYKKDITICKRENNEIISQFRDQGVKQDISSLLDKISEYQSSINEAIDIIKDIEYKEENYKNSIISREEFGLNYRVYLNDQKNKIGKVFNDLKKPKESWSGKQNKLISDILLDIKIHGKLVLNIPDFYSGLAKCLNMGKFKKTSNKTQEERLTEFFDIKSEDDFFDFVCGKNKINCEGEDIFFEDLLWKSEYFNHGGRHDFLEYFLLPEKIKSYLHVNAEFQYKGKTVDKLSIGQRGTFYVCLKLATDPFRSPFVFDQPEDDLDNEFIMKQLVPLFKKIKKYRQVIIVTHNANLVVNTDAEQVIVASNEGEIINYKSGALEDGDVKKNKGIRASICDILEGGSHAFEKREKKYGIQAIT